MDYLVGQQHSTHSPLPNYDEKRASLVYLLMLLNASQIDLFILCGRSEMSLHGSSSSRHRTAPPASSSSIA